MANKRKLHHWLVVVLRLHVWQLVVLLLMSSFLSAYLLRQNSLGMVERREAVKQADRDGKDVQKPLQELRNYVTTHMNTSLGDKGVYLETAYKKAYDAALQTAISQGNPASSAYQQASLECRSRFVGGRESFRNDYVQCVIDRVGSMGGAQDPMAGFAAPKADLYRYNFVTPLWSPDLAGFSVALTLLIAFIIVVRILFVVMVKLILGRRKS